MSKVNALVKTRPVAFKLGKTNVYNKLRIKVQREIKKAKVNFYANRPELAFFRKQIQESGISKSNKLPVLVIPDLISGYQSME